MRKRIFAFLLILISVVFGLVLAEILLRFFAPDWLQQRMKWTNLDGDIHYGTDAGWPVETLNGKFLRFKPGSRFPVRYYEYNNTVHINSSGTRSTGLSETQKPALPFVGDSFTFGLGVEDNQTYASLLGQRFQQFSVLNAGLPGSALPNQLDLIRLRNKDFRSPAVYVFSFYLGNDFLDILKYYHYGQKTIKKDNQRWIDELTNNPVFGKLYLVQLIEILASKSRYEEKVGRPVFSFHGRQVPPKFLMINDAVPYKEIIRVYLDRSLKELAELSHQLKFQPFFVIIPDKHQLSEGYVAERVHYFGLSHAEIDPRYPDQFLAEELRKNKIPFVDLYDCLKGQEGMYYVKDDHFTASGHKAAADCIYDPLSRFLSNN